ncbi:alkaline phosphatase family protein [Kocuria rhizophila]|uniref:alkaline phosphatase family protein n=1 Tax=Kocuria rhizophila TaxID=72000 RepID=UPI000C87C219|nr:nucleotide pyrophosphatase/phosphodiesterase family protein [Kocuria rhizophila]MCT1957763.1 alkaline phosphatase family protein [Kocuria rhizophila]MCT2073816.1 alkaline phosphatase family protein [Kocuria rhizophila]PMR89846.1 alkaline phosphatase family protein [Kocuria rhizophila]
MSARELPRPPRYGSRSIADVLSSAAAATGVPGTCNALSLPAAHRYVVVLVDGLGSRLLREVQGYAPTLRSAQSLGELDAAFPSTTSVSLSCLGTGAAPGTHGMLGYDVLDPATERVVNMLGQWPADVDPLAWQPVPTVLERAAEHVDTATVSAPRFESSGLTRAALRGGRFVGADGVYARTARTLEQLREGRRGLVYFYWDELDKTGHRVGWRSDAWLRSLEELDSALKRLVTRLPANTRVLLTADHGMVDVGPEHRLDVSGEADLVDGVRHTAGEPRAVQLHLSAHADPEDVARRWQEHFGDAVWTATRTELARAGYFGADPDPRMLARAGDVWILGKEEIALYDVSRQGTRPLGMVGQHGSLTDEERYVPALLW